MELFVHRCLSSLLEPQKVVLSESSFYKKERCTVDNMNGLVANGDGANLEATWVMWLS